MIELLLPAGVIGSLFFMLGLVAFPGEICKAMTFKGKGVMWELVTWMFFAIFISTIVFATSKVV
ncbi:hypothetical protein [Pseudoalteromonas sp.]|uniref:hypothetical protein n=1 Tax=Pseudoalteromonas sp. TaxID=53249 RepID=UPI0035660749